MLGEWLLVLGLHEMGAGVSIVSFGEVHEDTMFGA